MKVKSFSSVQLFVTPWTVAYQASPSMGFSRQEYQSGLPFPSPGDLPDPGIKPGSPELQADALPSEPPLQFSSVAQSCQTLSDPMDCSPPGSPVHGIFQARVLEWVAIAFSKVVSNSLQSVDCSMSGSSVLYYLPKSVQIHVH